MRWRCLCEIPLEQVTRTRCLYGFEEVVAASPSTASAGAAASEFRLRLRVCLVNEAGGILYWRVDSAARYVCVCVGES